MKSAEFHEIRRISWNPADFTELKWHRPPAPGPLCEVKFCTWVIRFIAFRHEVCRISWNLPDSMSESTTFHVKSTTFHEIHTEIHICKKWGLRLSPSIGLSIDERPNSLEPVIMWHVSTLGGPKAALKKPNTAQHINMPLMDDHKAKITTVNPTMQNTVKIG